MNGNVLPGDTAPAAAAAPIGIVNPAYAGEGYDGAPQALRAADEASVQQQQRLASSRQGHHPNARLQGLGPAGDLDGGFLSLSHMASQSPQVLAQRGDGLPTALQQQLRQNPQQARAMLENLAQAYKSKDKSTVLKRQADGQLGPKKKKKMGEGGIEEHAQNNDNNNHNSNNINNSSSSTQQHRHQQPQQIPQQYQSPAPGSSTSNAVQLQAPIPTVKSIQQAAEDAAVRNRQAHLMLQNIVPNIGPYVVAARLLLHQHLSNVKLALRSGVRDEVHWALNALTIISFDAKLDVPLNGLDGLVEVLVDFIKAALDAVEGTQPPTYAYDAAALETPLPGTYPAWPDQSEWWWNKEPDLFADAEPHNHHFTWGVCASNIIRNFSHKSCNHEILSASPALQDVISQALQCCLQCSSPLSNELCLNCLDIVHNLGSSLVSNTEVQLPRADKDGAPPPPPSSKGRGGKAQGREPGGGRAEARDAIVAASVAGTFSDQHPHLCRLVSSLGALLTHGAAHLAIRSRTALALGCMLTSADSHPALLVSILQAMGAQVAPAAPAAHLRALLELVSVTEEDCRAAAAAELDGALGYLDVMTSAAELPEVQHQVLALKLQADALLAATFLLEKMSSLGCMKRRGSKAKSALKCQDEDPDGLFYDKVDDIRQRIATYPGLLHYLVHVALELWPVYAARHGHRGGGRHLNTSHPMAQHVHTLLASAARNAGEVLLHLASTSLGCDRLAKYQMQLAVEAMSNSPYAATYCAILAKLSSHMRQKANREQRRAHK